MMFPYEDRFYERRIGYVTALLRRALNSGEKGLLQSNATNARIYALNMNRSYEAALKWSLDASLTRNHCDCIDQRSHEIELLKARLERKIVNLRRRNTSRIIRYLPKRRTDVRSTVELFIAHCANVRKTAKKMRKMNADLMASALSRISNRSRRGRSDY